MQSIGYLYAINLRCSLHLQSRLRAWDDRCVTSYPGWIPESDHGADWEGHVVLVLKCQA